MTFVLDSGRRKIIGTVVSLLANSQRCSKYSIPTLSGYPPLQARNYSSSYFPLVPSSLLHTTQAALDTLHQSTGLPWWAVIVGCSLSLRLFVSLPISVWHGRKVAKQELLLPKLKVLQNSMIPSLVARCRQANMSHDDFKKRFNKEAKKIAYKLFRQEGCNAYKVVILPWMQFPLWVILSFALRDMTIATDNTVTCNADMVADLATGGIFWFQNLMVPDPYLLLPLCSTLFFIANIELNQMLAGSTRSRFQRILIPTLRILTLPLGFIMCYLPTAVVLYLAMACMTGFIQSCVLMVPRTKRILNIPKVPSEKEKPFQYLLDTAHSRVKAFTKLQRHS